MSDSHKNPSEVSDSIVYRSEMNISGDVDLRDSIVYKPTINLHLDEKMMKRKFIRNFFGVVPFSQTQIRQEAQRTECSAGGKMVWTLPVETPEIGNRTLVGIKVTIRKEIRTLKSAHRKFLAKIAVNESKKRLLEERIEKLKATIPASVELPHLENTIRIMERYPGKAELLNRKIDEMTDLLHAVTAVQEEERFSKDLKGTCAAAEGLLGSAVRVAGEAEEITEESE